MQVAPPTSDARFRLALLPPGGLQSIESAFSLLLALQVMRSELQARENVTTYAFMPLLKCHDAFPGADFAELVLRITIVTLPLLQMQVAMQRVAGGRPSSAPIPAAWAVMTMDTALLMIL